MSSSIFYSNSLRKIKKLKKSSKTKINLEIYVRTLKIRLMKLSLNFRNIHKK